MSGTMQRTEGCDRLSPPFHPPHPTTTFALFEHRFAGAFDNPGSNRDPRTPIAGVIEAIVMKRKIGLFALHDFLGRR